MQCLLSVFFVLLKILLDVTVFDSFFMFHRIFIKPPPQRGWCYLFHSICATKYTVKKGCGFPVSRQDVNYSRPGGVWSVTSWLKTGKSLPFFNSLSQFLVKHKLWNIFNYNFSSAMARTRSLSGPSQPEKWGGRWESPFKMHFYFYLFRYCSCDTKKSSMFRTRVRAWLSIIKCPL